MNLTRKIFAVVTAGLLTLGAAGGMALADSSSSPGVTITLNGGVTACSAASNAVSFGTYNWMGGKYQRDTSDPGKLTITVTVNEAYGESGHTCTVSAWLGVLSGPGGSQFNAPINLDSENTASNFSSPHPLSRDAATPSELGSGLSNGIAYSWVAQDIPSGTLFSYAPGSYTGTLTLSGVASTP